MLKNEKSAAVLIFKNKFRNLSVMYFNEPIQRLVIERKILIIDYFKRFH